MLGAAKNVAGYHHGLLWCVCTCPSLTALNTCLALSCRLKRSFSLLVANLAGMKWHLKKYQIHDLAAQTRSHMVQDTVGIKHAGFIQRIVEYCEKSSNNSFCTLSVEGNISAGKSTFLDSISAHCPDLQDLLHVILLSLSPPPFSPGLKF